MPSSEYTSGGGALRLKGGGSGIDKKKKKKRPTKPPSTTTTTTTEVTAVEPSNTSSTPNAKPQLSSSSRSPTHTPRGRSVSPDSAQREIQEASGTQGRQKTEAEKRHDERRRKRLEDRLKREGLKTHKEKVEELNKYLSGLSEHHDMPKIGPG